MKKLLMIGALLVTGLTTYSKEVVSAPVDTVEPVVAITPVVAPIINPWVLSLRGGSDVIWSEYQYGESDSDGWEIGLELSKFLNPHWSLGLGVMYQDFGSISVDPRFHNDSDKFSVPVYATTKFYFSNIYEGIRPYVKANLGYAKINKMQDGLYWAAGAGMEYNNWFLDLMYQDSSSENDSSSYGENDYSRVTLGFGYNFYF